MITNFSRQTIEKHDYSLKINQKSIKQEHKIKAISICECHYKDKKKLKSFYIYGSRTQDTDSADVIKVYSPNFLSNISCSIM